MPGLVRVEPHHCLCDVCRTCSEILFIDHALLVNEEGLDTGNAILGGPGNEAEPADHQPANQIVLRTSRRSWSLSSQNLEIVAMVRRRFIASLGVALHYRFGYTGSQWTLRIIR